MDCDRVQATGKVRKRKAESQDNNERLHKRLSLLNLERNGEKLYVPVEHPTASTPTYTPMPSLKPTTTPNPAPNYDDMMQLDDTKNKVYIYDLDAELSDSDSSSDEAKLIFLPDIQKHLRSTRIPPMVLANSDGELAGNNQLVLYNIPSSLTVPEEHDSVRKAIMEARERVRKRQEEERVRLRYVQTDVKRSLGQRDWVPRMIEKGTSSIMPGDTGTGSGDDGMDVEPSTMVTQGTEDDPDAMDLG